MSQVMTQNELDQMLSKATAFAPSVTALSEDVTKQHIQRQGEVWTALLSMVSGRPAFFLGTPGIDKTGAIKAIIRRIAGALFYEQMMPMLSSGTQLIVESTALLESMQADGSKIISTVDQIGRVAGKGVKIFFADEIWKTQQFALKETFDLFNMDEIRHDGQLHENPLWTALAASNELPDPESGLEALWSRMIIRVPVKSLDRGGKVSLIQSRLQRYRNVASGKETPIVRLTLDDVELLRKARPFVEVPDDIVTTLIDKIYQELFDENPGEFDWLWEDDRRLGRVVDVLQANALLKGRSIVTKQDFKILEWLLWNTPEQIEVVTAKIAPYCRTPLSDAQETVDTLKAPGGFVDQTLNVDRKFLVKAIDQCETALADLAKFKAEADSTEATAIQALIDDIEHLKGIELLAVLQIRR